MKYNQKSFEIIKILFLILVIGLIGGLGWFVYQHKGGSTGTVSGSKASSEIVLNHRLPLADCSKLKPKIQQLLQTYDGDICYAAPITASGETFEYVMVDQSESYKEKVNQYDTKNCRMDCGSTISIPGPQGFIIRANGRAEFANSKWTGLVDTALESLTGCPLGDLSRYNNDGVFIVNNGRIGIHFTGKNIAYSQRYGSSCSVTIDVVAYVSIGEPALLFHNIAVKYRLADPNTCASKNVADSSANADAEQCYSDQAGMRGDIAICDKTYFSGTGTDSSGCIQAVATRNRDLSICQRTDQNDKRQCVYLVNEARSYFSGEIKAAGL
jgi:hypothetical protein